MPVGQVSPGGNVVTGAVATGAVVPSEQVGQVVPVVDSVANNI